MGGEQFLSALRISWLWNLPFKEEQKQNMISLFHGDDLYSDFLGYNTVQWVLIILKYSPTGVRGSMLLRNAGTHLRGIIT